jgi:hypothetical protein
MLQLSHRIGTDVIVVCEVSVQCGWEFVCFSWFALSVRCVLRTPRSLDLDRLNVVQLVVTLMDSKDGMHFAQKCPSLEFVNAATTTQKKKTLFQNRITHDTTNNTHTHTQRLVVAFILSF